MKNVVDYACDEMINLDDYIKNGSDTGFLVFGFLVIAFGLVLFVMRKLEEFSVF